MMIVWQQWEGAATAVASPSTSPPLHTAAKLYCFVVCWHFEDFANPPRRPHASLRGSAGSIRTRPPKVTKLPMALGTRRPAEILPFAPPQHAPRRVEASISTWSSIEIKGPAFV